MLLRCCLIHISIVTIPDTILILIICLDLGLFISCLCDLFFICIIIFTMINLTTTDTLSYFLKCALPLLDDNVDEECE